MNKKYIIVGVVVVALLLLVGFFMRPVSLGGTVHSAAEIFYNGFLVGDKTNAACLKVRDTDESGWSYITFLNGVQTVTGGDPTMVQGAVSSYQWTIPADCAELEDIQGRAL